jgi:phenylalanyl-tRNA synthetase beta chain
MLCFEGISLMLKIFLGKAESPQYKLVPPAEGEMQMINVHEEVRHAGIKDVMSIC